jgi:hypothetical protein
MMNLRIGFILKTSIWTFVFWIYITFSKIVSELDPNIKALVIRMDRVPFVDQSGLYALEEAFFNGKRTY